MLESHERIAPGRERRGARAAAFVVVSLVVALVAGRARAEEPAVDHQKKATAAFALGHYAVAADEFEKAFALSPEPALLYNAAQAYRLGGNKERALTLYENYLRVYGSQEKGPELQSRIAELKKAIEHDRAVAAARRSEEPVAAPPAPLPAAPAPKATALAAGGATVPALGGSVVVGGCVCALCCAAIASCSFVICC